MLRRPIRRSLAVLAGAAFLLGVASHAFALRQCPHHGGVPHGAPGAGHEAVPASAGPAELLGSHDGAAHPVPAPAAVAAPVAADAVPASDADEPAHGPCTCVGECQGSGGALLPDVDATAVVVAGLAVPVVFPSHAALPLAAPAPYLLPFANGPPHLV